MSARAVYRKLYRELSYQALEASKAHSAQQKTKQAAIEAYRKRAQAQAKAAKDGVAAPQADPEVQASRRLTEGPLYDSTILRQLFTQSEPEKYNLSYADEVLAYLQSQRTYKDLLARYNPGSTMEDEERIRLSAQRVGLALPQTMREQLSKLDL